MNPKNIRQELDEELKSCQIIREDHAEQFASTGLTYTQPEAEESAVKVTPQSWPKPEKDKRYDE